MSLTTDRDAIVAVLGGVGGLSPSRTVPAPIVTGSAWPVWLDLSFTTISQTLSRWSVLVAVTNADQSSTVEAADALIEDVAFALMGVGKVGAIEPVATAVEAGQQSIPCIRFGLEI